MDEYEKEILRYHNLHTKNILAQDTALLQLSVGLVAILATFGNSILTINKTLSFLVFIAFGATIIFVVLGYYFSNKFFVDAKTKIAQNKHNHPDKHTNFGLDTIIFGKINNWINSAQLVTFFLGIVFLGFILFSYLKGLK